MTGEGAARGIEGSGEPARQLAKHRTVVRGSQDALRTRLTEKRCKMPNNGERSNPLCQRMFLRVLRGDTLLSKRISSPLLEDLRIAAGQLRA